jgi:hypothetical protein
MRCITEQEIEAVSGANIVITGYHIQWDAWEIGQFMNDLNAQYYSDWDMWYASSGGGYAPEPERPPENDEMLASLLNSEVSLETHIDYLEDRIAFLENAILGHQAYLQTSPPNDNPVAQAEWFSRNLQMAEDAEALNYARSTLEAEQAQLVETERMIQELRDWIEDFANG